AWLNVTRAQRAPADNRQDSTDRQTDDQERQGETDAEGEGRHKRGEAQAQPAALSAPQPGSGDDIEDGQCDEPDAERGEHVRPETLERSTQRPEAPWCHR